MRYYRAEVHIGGDRNHVVVRQNMPAPELAVIMMIHGQIALQKVEEMPNTGVDRTPLSEVQEYLDETYGRVRIGEGDDRRSVLRAVFPTWPQVAHLPGTAKEAGVPEHHMRGSSPEDKVAEAKMRERIEAEIRAEQEAKADAEEFARQEQQEQQDEEAAQQDSRSDLQKLKDQAAELGVDPADIKKAGKSKVKLAGLIATAQAGGDNIASAEQNEQEEESADFMS